MKRLNLLLTGLLLGTACLSARAQLTERYSFTNLNRAIPDGSSSGLSEVRTINSAIVNLSSVRLKLSITGEFNGDLYAYVRHIQGGKTNFCVLLNRVGRTAQKAAGNADAGMAVIFDDAAASGDIHVSQAVTNLPAGLPLSGTWQPDGRWVDPNVALDTSARTTTLRSFNGADANGEWTLFVADVAPGGTNQLVGWELELAGQAIPAMSWPTPSDITYGTGLGPSQLNASFSIPGTLAYTPPAGTILNAGPNQVLSATFSPADTSSYSPVTTNVTINVLKKALAVTANSTNKVYGAPVPGLTVSFSGFVAGDTPNSLTTQPALSTTATAASPVGSYPIIASGVSSSNYTISYTAGALAVTPAALTITANGTSKVYGAPVPDLTASFSGFVNGDTPSSLTTQPVLSTTATAASPVGNYAIIASGASSSNYTINYAGGILAVTPAALTITANSTNKVYGAPVPGLTASFSGFVNGDTPGNLSTQPVLSTVATAASPVGTYAIAARNASASNYTISYAGGTLTVLPASSTGLLSSSVNPALPGQTVALTLILGAVAPGQGTPTGTVQFRIDGTSVGGPVPLASGTATYTTAALPHGRHSVVAEYAGDGNFLGTTNTLAAAQLINTLPVAGPVTIHYDAAKGAKVSTATLLGYASDADGDPLAFLGVSAASANGGTVAINNGWVFYTPAAGFTNTDTFTYTVTDNLGAPVAGTVTVVLNADNDVSTSLTMTSLGGTSYLIRGNGIPNRVYHIQYADTPNGPNWQTLGAATADQYGVFQYTNSAGSTQRYYRSVYP